MRAKRLTALLNGGDGGRLIYKRKSYHEPDGMSDDDDDTMIDRKSTARQLKKQEHFDSTRLDSTLVENTHLYFMSEPMMICICNLLKLHTYIHTYIHTYTRAF